jgi:hypothetical protein
MTTDEAIYSMFVLVVLAYRRSELVGQPDILQEPVEIS